MYLHITLATILPSIDAVASDNTMGRISDMQQATNSDLDVVVIGSALVELTPKLAGRSLEGAELNAKVWGMKTGVGCAEAFRTVRNLI